MPRRIATHFSACVMLALSLVSSGAWATEDSSALPGDPIVSGPTQADGTTSLYRRNDPVPLVQAQLPEANWRQLHGWFGDAD